MSTPVAPLRVAIAGGGIAGLCTALALAKRIEEGANIKLDIYEQAPAFGEVGAGVALGPNSQEALRLIGLGDELNKVSGDTSDPDLWFKFIIGEAGEDAGKEFAQVRGKDAAQGEVHRADFLDQLVKKLPSSYTHFDRRATTYAPHANGVTITFETTSNQRPAGTAECDVLIASDGVKSTLRAHLYERKGLKKEDQQCRYSGWAAYRGLIKREKYEEVYGKDQSDKLMHCGTGRHILTFPIRGGKLVNIVAFVRDTERAQRLGKTAPWTEPRPTKELLEDFKNFSDDCKALLKEIDEPSEWGIFTVPSIEHAVDDRVVIIGDAAHASTPHQGAGAGQAVEDALFISTLISNPAVTNSLESTRAVKIQKALDLYHAARHPRSDAVRTTSDEAGLLYEFLSPVGRDLEAIKKDLEGDRLKTIWDYDFKNVLSELVAELEKEEQ